MKRKKSLRLQFTVYLIIALLMFSVIGVVVVYLNGIQTQQAQYDAFIEQQNQDAAVPVIDIAPLPTQEEVPSEEGVEGVDEAQVIEIANPSEDTVVIEGNAAAQVEGEVIVPATDPEAPAEGTQE